MIRHLYQRTITRNGKKIKAWYYWFYDENGKQVRKSCGTDGKPCLRRRDAEIFLENLREETAEKENKKISFNDYCNDFYEENSRYLKKQLARGFKFQPKTIYIKNLYLQKFLSAFGNCVVSEIRSGDIENWLIDLKYSNSLIIFLS